VNGYLSTNRAHVEMDYYTAVDDLKPEDTAGADMIGTVEFTAPCFYRYANVDFDQLTENLHGDHELALKTVEAFLRATVEAIPTGKQNSMAAHNPPDLVLAVVRERGLWSLANAFVQPVRPDQNHSLMQNSIKALDRYWGKLAKGYGDEGILARPIFVLEEADVEAEERTLLTSLKNHQVGGLNELVKQVLTTLQRVDKPQEVLA
jgi:CRISPR system Cascade subunit CasC